MVKALKSGGVVIFNSRKTAGNAEYQKILFGHLDDMVKAKKITLLKKEEIAYYGKPCQETGKPMPGFAFVYRKL